MKNSIRTMILSAATMAAVGAMSLTAAYSQEKTFKIGLALFLSGPGAEAFGVPSLNGAKLIVDALNAGEVPAPYDKKGIGGLPIELVPVDEAGSAQVQIQRFRDLVQREKVDAVIGYDGSGGCLAVASVAEELKALTLFSGCGTPRIFEDGSYKYVFRAGAHSTMDNVALARYAASTMPDLKTFAGFNQNYSWGQDSWTDFKLSMKQLMPKAESVEELFPEFGSGQYGAQISTLLRRKPELIHSSFWGGDLEAFLMQATPRNVFASSRIMFANAEHVLPRLGKKIPNGLITGGRGAVGLIAPKNALSDWLKDAHLKKLHQPALQGPFRISQPILALKTAAEKAMAQNQGVKPTTDQIVAALENLSFEAPTGTIRMALGNGHQAIQDAAVGVASWDDAAGAIKITDLRIFKAECVNPPPGVKSSEWIKAGFPGAKCD